MYRSQTHRMEDAVSELSDNRLHELWDRANRQGCGRVAEICAEEYERRLDREASGWDDAYEEERLGLRGIHRCDELEIWYREY